VVVIGVGQLGSDIVKSFEEEYEVIPLAHSDIEVSDYKSCEVLKGLKPDVVINTAAYHKTDECEDFPEKTFSVNALGARNIAKVCEEVGAVNIYISTDYVFDGEKDVPYSESDVPNPVNVYGVSKYAGEIFTRNISSRYYIFRVSSLFGVAGARGKGGNFVETMIKNAKNGVELKVVDDIVMSPTYTKDASMAMLKVLENELDYGTYHISNNGYCSWYEFAKAIFEITGMDASLKPITSDEYPTKARRPRNSSLSVEKLRKMGVEIRHWKSALRSYLEEKGHI
jgi:dTDP-4-dehydrorhamnose reductase